MRYAIGYGSDAPHALAAHPHGYLAITMPAILVALAAAIGGVAMRAARGRMPAARIGSARVRSFGLLWLACAAALATTFGVQETLEGAGAFAGSGWIGFALALPVGFVVALAMRGADAAEALRPPAAVLRSAFVAYSDTPAAPRRALGRLAAATVAARGPPASFVV